MCLDFSFQGKHRDFFLLAPDEASHGVVVNYGMDGLMGGPGSPVREQGCPSPGNRALVNPGVPIRNTCLAVISLLRGAFMLSGALRL